MFAIWQRAYVLPVKAAHSNEGMFALRFSSSAGGHRRGVCSIAEASERRLILITLCCEELLIGSTST